MCNRLKTHPLIATLVLLSATLVGCDRGAGPSESDQRAQVETALDEFVAKLVADFPAPEALPGRIRAYVEAHPTFYGSTVAVIGENGRVSHSPYVYRREGKLTEVDLVTPAYDIDNQAWLVAPRDTKRAVWTDLYFDAGGGNIWMVTRSVPLLRDAAVYAVATTDLPVDAPDR
jgi:Methyl-accepting chemotaxis protein-like, first PDC sensor domain